jgi:aminocarboxymuconate-semialdehyde decarboxylase
MAEKLINGSGARIDVHAHAFTPEFTRVLRKSVSRPLAIRSIWEWDENRFLGEMDRWNVTLQVLSLPQMYEYFDWGNRQPAVEMAQVANDEYAQICVKHPERFRMFASIPMMDADQACKELERARRLPGFSGITLCTHIRERALDEAEFAAFFAYANASGLAMFLHPLERPLPKEWNVYRLDHLIGLPVDTTFALSRLALGGFFDKYPNLKVIAAHVGGAIPFLARRIERAFREGKSEHKPSHYFGQLFYDTAGPTDEAIVACVARMFGSEQIVFGTDYPFGLGQEGKQYVEHAVGVVDGSGLGEADLAKIYGGNARRLLHIEQL